MSGYRFRAVCAKAEELKGAIVTKGWFKYARNARKTTAD